MTKRSIIIGMGIGNLYKDVLTKIGHEVVTVDLDPNKGADFTSVQDAVRKYSIFDTAHVCTPNYTHKDVAEKIAPFSKIVFVEKPGFQHSTEWTDMIRTRPFTRFMMVKNNMWRDNIDDLITLAAQASSVDIQWIRKNCIPHPGSWFTTRKLAFGGVSRDLMPHLLSLYVAMNPNWRMETAGQQTALTAWQLKDIDSTDYGVIDPDGTYDVDDMCMINFGHKWQCAANWRSMDQENSSIKFTMPNNSVETFELGWCPEQAYHNMIIDAINHMDDHTFWLNQYEVDTWIQERIQNL